jgi:hypothetical protein
MSRPTLRDHPEQLTKKTVTLSNQIWTVILSEAFVSGVEGPAVVFRICFFDALYQGITSVVPQARSIDEGYGLQPVHQSLHPHWKSISATKSRSNLFPYKNSAILSEAFVSGVEGPAVLSRNKPRLDK